MNELHDVKIIDETLVFNCPHCKQEIIVLYKEINCKIFRHAVYKHNFEQINPHLPKIECDELFINDKVYGCAKPFELVFNNGKWFVTICEYK